MRLLRHVCGKHSPNTTHRAPMLFSSASSVSTICCADCVVAAPAVFGVATFPATLFLLLSAMLLQVPLLCFTKSVAVQTSHRSSPDTQHNSAVLGGLSTHNNRSLARRMSRKERQEGKGKNKVGMYTSSGRRCAKQEFVCCRTRRMCERGQMKL